MASGLGLPLFPVRGRAPIETGEKQLVKIILLKVADCQNENPFNDLGSNGDIIFQLNNESTQALVRSRISDTFDALQRKGRAKLAPGFPTFKVDSATQEMTCSIKFIDLETDEEQDFSFPINSPFGVNGR